MHIDTVRKMLNKRIIDSFESQADYSRKIGVTTNNICLFLSGKGAYADRVPKKVLDDLGLGQHTVTTYHKKVCK